VQAKAANAPRGGQKRVAKSKTRKAKNRAGPTFVATFADGQVTRMTICTALENLDVDRGLRISRAAYEARARRPGERLHPIPPPIVRAHFEQADKVLAHYSPDALGALPEAGGAP
jgi:hypothetical protein